MAKEEPRDIQITGNHPDVGFESMEWLEASILGDSTEQGTDVNGTGFDAPITENLTGGNI